MFNNEGPALGLGLGITIQPGGGGGGDAIVPQFTLRNPEKIESAIAALVGADADRATIVWVGHSVPWGVGADGTSNTNFAAAQVARTDSMAAVVCDALNDFLSGATSYGFESFAAGSSGYYTLGGGLSESSPFGPAGVGGERINLASGAATSATFLAQGTAVRVLGYTTALNVSPRYTINGGATQIVPASTSADPTGHAANNVWWPFVISGLTPGDTIVLLAPASTGGFICYGVDLDYRTDAGVTVHRACYPGQMLVQIFAPALDSADALGPGGNWPGAPNEAIRTTQGHSLTRLLNADLVIFQTDINDLKGYNSSGTDWEYDLDDCVNHMTRGVEFCEDLGIPCLIVTGTIRDPQLRIDDGVPFDQAQLIATYRAISDNSTNCAFFDLTSQYVGDTLDDRYDLQQASGLIQDTVHPNAAGHIFFGDLIADALIAAMEEFDPPLGGDARVTATGDTRVTATGDRRVIA